MLESTETGVPLPNPNSAELAALVPDASTRVVYAILYEHPGEGITMEELRRQAAPRLAAIGRKPNLAYSTISRKKIDLKRSFVIQLVRAGHPPHRPRHVLVGRRRPLGS